MDWIKRKLLSRKFLAVVGVCTAAAFGAVPADQCIQVITVWLAAEGTVDAVSSYRNKEKK